MTEQLGLADAIRYIWVLHDRYLPAGSSVHAYYPSQGYYGYTSTGPGGEEYSWS